MPTRNSAAPSPSSRFAKAVAATPALAKHYRRGLRALESADASHVSVQPRTQLTGSVYVDRALEAALPNSPRWDYAIGLGRVEQDEEILWLEVHDASGGRCLHEMGDKLTWLLGWLKSDAPAMNCTPRRIVWVASGRSSFSGNDPKLRLLRSRGLEFVGGHLRV